MLSRAADAVDVASSALLRRIQNEHHEMPGLILTEAQARRLWGMGGKTCRAVLSALLERRFLRRTTAGTYIRALD
jgi:Fic family protein